MRLEIQHMLKEKNMTRYELAKRIGVTYPTIDRIYKGTSTSIKFEILESICRELDCSLDDILHFEYPELKERQTKRLHLYYNAFMQWKKNSGTNE